MIEHRDGIFFDLDEEAYHADPALGSTDLRRLLISGPDYWWRSPFNPTVPQPEPTPQLTFGKALHRLVLEGHQAFSSRYVRRPDDIERMSPKLRAELCPNGEIVLDADDYNRIVLSAEMIKANPELATAFEGGVPEVSVFWTEEMDGGFRYRCKARFDFLKPRGIGDLKSIRNFMNRPFGDACARAIHDHRYDVQACHYLRGRWQLPQMVTDGAVFGDHDRAWLERVAKTEAFAFQWVFFQAEGAPITWSRSLSLGNPILDIAWRDRTRAIETYRNFIDAFGPDQMWTLRNDPVIELDIAEMPAWFR